MENLKDESWYRRPSDVPVRLSAGGVVARLQGGEVLIALTREITRGHKLPGYVLPKGGVRDGETLLEAARREIREEAGLSELRLMAHLGTGEHLNWEKTRWVHAHYFLFVTDQVHGKPTDVAHHYAMGWFPLDEPPPLCWRDQRALLERNRERIRRLLLTPG